MILYLAWFFASVLIFYGTLEASKESQKALMTYFMVALGLFVGFGDMLGGYDRYIYADLFDSMADVTHNGGNPWTSYAFGFYGGEFGYGTFCALLSYVTGNRYIFILIATMVIYALLIVSLRQYVDNAPFAVVMFMGLWFFFTFTYLRQVIGCTVAWLSVRYIVERDLGRFLLVWFIAFSFHNSVIIFLPFFWVPLKKYPRSVVIGVMVVAFLLGAFTSIPQGLFNAYGSVDDDRIAHGNYAREYGLRWEYLLEAGFFLYIILTNYENISNKAKNVVMLNMALVFCFILLFFLKSINGGRLGWIYMIGVICTMSNICVKNSKVLKNGALMVVVCFFLFFRILDSWGIQLSPYKTFLTNGYRTGDVIRDKYEYDFNYETDKFYRPVVWWVGDY